MINLGDLVKDEITGFQGVVLARVEALYETTQCRVHPRSFEDRGPTQHHWIEEDRLVLLQPTAVVGFRSVAGAATPVEG